MRSNFETLRLISTGNINILTEGISQEGTNIIKHKINEIPSEFFEPRIKLDGFNQKSISLIEFSMQIAEFDTDKKLRAMKKYHISPYDINTLQRIIDSIKVAEVYERQETIEKRRNEEAKKQSTQTYGIALADHEKIDKAYPLWLAFIFANSTNPLFDIKERLKHDGVEDKYDPEYIVGLIEHTNILMEGKTENEKKDFYMSSIADILDDSVEKSNIIEKSIEIEI